MKTVVSLAIAVLGLTCAGGAVPPQLVDKLIARAQGNPFYLEELLNYLHDRGLDPRDPTALEKIDLPDSLRIL